MSQMTDQELFEHYSKLYRETINFHKENYNEFIAKHEEKLKSMVDIAKDSDSYYALKFIFLGKYLSRCDELKLSLPLFSKALQYAYKAQDLNLLVTAYNGLGNAYLLNLKKDCFIPNMLAYAYAKMGLDETAVNQVKLDLAMCIALKETKQDLIPVELLINSVLLSGAEGIDYLGDEVKVIGTLRPEDRTRLRGYQVKYFSDKVDEAYKEFIAELDKQNVHIDDYAFDYVKNLNQQAQDIIQKVQNTK